MTDLKPTPFKISTITATGSVNSLINLDVFYENVIIDPEGLMYIEYGKKKLDMICRGVNRAAKGTKKKDGKRFDNQVTCIIANGAGVANVKVFKNGKIQMTGLKEIDQGKAIIDCVIRNLHDLYSRGFTNVVGTVNALINCDYKIRLINSDFRIGIEIRRDRLNRLIQNSYEVLSSFEPCIYPGVKIQFFWNKTKSGCHDGICTCEGYCGGKGEGCGDGDCKKITVAVFQSGCIIITGAQTIAQIDDAYIFICNVIKNNRDELEKIPIKPTPRKSKAVMAASVSVL